MRKNLSSFILKLYGMTNYLHIVTYELQVCYIHITTTFHHRLCTKLQGPSSYSNIMHTTSLHIVYYTVSQGSICHSNTVYMDKNVMPGSWCLTSVHFYIQIGSYLEQHQ